MEGTHLQRDICVVTRRAFSQAEEPKGEKKRKKQKTIVGKEVSGEDGEPRPQRPNALPYTPFGHNASGQTEEAEAGGEKGKKKNKFKK